MWVEREIAVRRDPVVDFNSSGRSRILILVASLGFPSNSSCTSRIPILVAHLDQIGVAA